MTREEFDRLVDTIERGVGRRPAALKRRVLWLVVLGYAGLLMWLGVVLLLAAAFFAAGYASVGEGRVVCVVLGLLIFFGGGYAALRALLVKLPPPTGRRLTANEAPELFRVLAELQRQLRSVPFHEVLVTVDCNAGVSQVPRLGVLGWSRNYLLLGLPLLESLTPDEMRAVLAHEFTHLSRAHGRFSHWLYRLRRSWERIFQQLSQPRHRGQVSFRPLILKSVKWFWPRFNAHAFVLSRAHEYEADAQAAALIGRPAAASALIRLQLSWRLLDEKLWPSVWEQATEKPAPPENALAGLCAGIREEPPAAESLRWQGEALRAISTNSDTHPCLTERLRALDALPATAAGDPLAPRVTSAADAFLGAARAGIWVDVEKEWRSDVTEAWRERHARANALSHRLSALSQAVPDPSADADSLWDQARTLLELKGDKTLEPLLRKILALRPTHAPANFYLGRLLLDGGLAEGETFLERAIDEDEDVLPQACELLLDHYRRSGRNDKLREVEQRLDRHERELEASQKERSEISARDALEPHGLTAGELEKLNATLAGDPQLARAWLVRKKMQIFPKQKFFVLCVQRWLPWHRLPNADQDRVLVARLSRTIQLPGRVLVIAPTGTYSAVARKIIRTPESEVYRHAQAK